MRRVVKRGIVA